MRRIRSMPQCMADFADIIAFYVLTSHDHDLDPKKRRAALRLLLESGTCGERDRSYATLIRHWEALIAYDFLATLPIEEATRYVSEEEMGNATLMIPHRQGSYSSTYSPYNFFLADDTELTVINGSPLWQQLVDEGVLQEAPLLSPFSYDTLLELVFRYAKKLSLPIGEEERKGALYGLLQSGAFPSCNAGLFVMLFGIHKTLPAVEAYLKGGVPCPRKKSLAQRRP